jgi:cytochrome d ubiquinol oxidase subunit I
MVVAASFGLASALCVVVLGDESGYTATINQKMKIAGIEAMWETEPPPASFTVFGIPDQKREVTDYAVRVPYLLGLIATRSLDTPVPGIKELVNDAEKRIRDGLKAYDALVYLRTVDHNNKAKRATLEAHAGNLGYALLLKRYVDDPLKATSAQIRMAAESTIPHVAVLFWSFRIMVGLGLYFIALFACAFWCINIHRRYNNTAFLKLCFLSLPLPWIAAELGWIVAEYGRQPWAIEGILPTFLGVSSVSAAQVWVSLSGFVAFYTALLVVDLYLLIKLVRLGPQGMGLGSTSKEAFA